MFNNDEIIEQELELLKQDIITAYEQSGKKVSGEFASELEIRTGDNTGSLWGVGYLAGRKAGTPPAVANIIKWVEARGIQPYIAGMTQSQLAFAIAYVIGRDGTKDENELKIYEQVVTPERIQVIIDRVSSINVTAFIDEVTAQLTLLTKDL